MCGSTVNVRIIIIALIAIGVDIRDVHAKRSRRIVGGEDAEENEFPWMARLNVTDKNDLNYDCGGAIISSRHILTTAHCLIDSTLNSIWTGTNIRDDRIAIESQFATYFVHDDYNYYSNGNSTHIENDVGIVVLENDLQLGENQQVISLTDKETDVDTLAVLPGWGFTGQPLKENRAMFLKKTYITIRPISECSAKTAIHLCGQSTANASPYYGDGGSSLVVDDRIVGLLSTTQLEPGQQSIYTNVYYYRDWIKLIRDWKLVD